MNSKFNAIIAFLFILHFSTNRLLAEAKFESVKSGNCLQGPTKFSAYAPPNVWGTWTRIGNHMGPVNVYIKAWALGNTTLFCRVRYWTDNEQVIQYFQDSISIHTGNVVGTIEVSFKGTPFGTGVKGHTIP